MIIAAARSVGQVPTASKVPIRALPSRLMNVAGTKIQTLKRNPQIAPIRKLIAASAIIEWQSIFVAFGRGNTMIRPKTLRIDYAN